MLFAFSAFAAFLLPFWCTRNGRMCLKKNTLPDLLMIFVSMGSLCQAGHVFSCSLKKEEKEIRSQCVCPHGRCVLRRSVAPIILLLLLLLLSSSSHFASFHFSSPIPMHANNISKTAAEGHTIFWSNRHTDLSLILFHSQTCFLFPFLSSRRAGFEFVVSFSNCLPLVFILRERF